MATYISLVNFTQQGIEKVKESPIRLDAVKKVYEAAGGKLLQFFLVMGRYDVMVSRVFSREGVVYPLGGFPSATKKR
jgi:uncharacterized protein with GYD domain